MTTFAVSVRGYSAALRTVKPGIVQGGNVSFLGNYSSDDGGVAILVAMSEYNNLLLCNSSTSLVSISFDDCKSVQVTPEDKKG